MRGIFIILFFVLSMGVLGCASWWSRAAEGETSKDSPWAGIAREAIREPSRPFQMLLQQYTPTVWSQMRKDSEFPFWMDLWGRSLNFDEGAQQVIVDPNIIDSLIRLFEAPPRQDSVVHAGVEHTYGYLFSLLHTPYGYKRARWVDGEIERGLGIPIRLLDEDATEGALLSNVTYLLASISLIERTDLRPWLIESAPQNVHSRIVDWTRTQPLAEIRRLIEIVRIGSRSVTLRTDFVPFHRSARRGGNSALLIYSVLDSELEGARLISAFPVQQAFVDRALDPDNLGERQPVSTRYNAYVSGFTDAAQPLMGDRSVEVLRAR
mgnify:CR=1 FL=1